MVLVTMAIVAVPLFWMTRGAAPREGSRLRRHWPVSALVLVVGLAAAGIYVFTGKHESTTVSVPAAATTEDVAAQHARNAVMGSQNAGDLSDAVERLRMRLAANPNDAEGWRLLARSYEYLGRTAEAAEADKRADQLASGGGVAPVAQAQAQTGETRDVLVQRAQEHRRRREFSAANLAFAELARRGQMDANLWADYADSLGGEHGRLDEQAADCIAQALRLDPRHLKALWLLGSLQTQKGDFSAALVTWQKLARLLPADSSDARIIAANIQEARARLAGGGAQAQPGPRAASLSGTVQVDARLRARVPKGATLFVFARAADERGPPVAVLRTTTGAWPLSFRLDDSNAMLPDRKLSNFSRVIVEARVSRSGDPIAQPGDLQAVSAVLDPHSASDLRLVIADEVGARAAQGS
jgi:cytochrome c-type biogenesis protein CcmH